MIVKNEILDVVRRGGFDVLITLGAGDIEDYSEQIAQLLEEGTHNQKG